MAWRHKKLCWWYGDAKSIPEYIGRITSGFKFMLAFLFCFVNRYHSLVFSSMFSGVSHWHWRHIMIAPVSPKVKQQHNIWQYIHISNHTKTKQSMNRAHLWNQIDCSTLYVQREHRHIFTFYVITPHWYDTCTENPSSSKTKTYVFYIVYIMAADVLAT